MKNLRLKSEMTSAGYTYLSFAERLREHDVDITEGRLCRIITGRCSATPAEKQAAAAVLDKPTWSLFPTG